MQNCERPPLDYILVNWETEKNMTIEALGLLQTLNKNDHLPNQSTMLFQSLWRYQNLLELWKLTSRSIIGETTYFHWFPTYFQRPPYWFRKGSNDIPNLFCQWYHDGRLLLTRFSENHGIRRGNKRGHVHTTHLYETIEYMQPSSTRAPLAMNRVSFGINRKSMKNHVNLFVSSIVCWDVISKSSKRLKCRRSVAIVMKSWIDWFDFDIGNGCLSFADTSTAFVKVQSNGFQGACTLGLPICFSNVSFTRSLRIRNGQISKLSQTDQTWKWKRWAPERRSELSHVFL